MSPTDTAVATAHAPNVPVRAAPVPRPSRLRRRLRGRWRRLTLGALGGALLGAAAGWFAGQPLYRAAVTLDVDAVLPAVDNPAERRTLEALLEERLAHEARLLETSAPAEDVAGVAVTRASQFPPTLEVELLAAEPATALAALRSLIDDHRATRIEEAHALEGRLHALAEHRQAAEVAVIEAHHRLAAEAEAFGHVPLEQFAAARARELGRIDDLIAQTRTALATAVAPAAEPAGDGELPLDELRTLARTDSTLASLLARREAVDEELATLRRRMGPGAPAVRTALAARRQADERIREHLQTAAAAPSGSADGQPGAALLLTGPQLRQRLEGLEERRGQLAADLANAQARRGAVEQREAEASAALARLRGVHDQLDQVTLQQQIAGTLRVGEPTASSLPYRDTRPLRAALGAAGGAFAGLMLVTLLLLADNRIRRPDRAVLDDPTAPLFGAVPTVDPTGLGADGPGGDAAAMCIHEIRALVQLRARSQGARAFAITSPSRGAGKTSLTVGLASSLALSGTRTLLVDCDLTRRANGPDADRGDASGRKSAAKDPNASHHLDQVMLQMGYLDDSDPELFLLSHDAGVGITGLLDGKPLAHCVIETSVPGLAVLPALSASSQHIARMSSAFVRRLIDEAKEDYDLVVFDTGPVPGSVEALVVTGEADAVILVVPRGELQSRFDRAVAYLRTAGANLAGTVFNRAAASDLTVQPGRAAGGKAKGKAGRSTASAAAAQRITGSGLLAAAVHAQSRQTIATGDTPASRADTTRRRTPPQAATGGPQAQPEDPARRGVPPARPAAPASARGPVDTTAADDDVSLADAGDITAILGDAAAPPPPRSRSKARPVGAARPTGSRPEFPVADADLENALDQLVSDARRNERPTTDAPDRSDTQPSHDESVRDASAGAIPMPQARRRAAGQ